MNMSKPLLHARCTVAEQHTAMLGGLSCVCVATVQQGLDSLQGDERHDRRQVREIQSLSPSTSLTTALGRLLESGASSLPVIDEVSKPSKLAFWLVWQPSFQTMLLGICKLGTVLAGHCLL